MADLDASSDAAFLAEFEASRIPHTAWTHRSHVRMAYLYTRERMMTWEAKRAFVEPDLLPLPAAGA